MFRFLYVCLGVLFAHTLLNAQNNLYIHRNIKAAYEKGTRAADGRPGANYWQNRAEYVMSVSLNPKKRLLSGQSTITYYNNSPDTLKIIRLKLAHDLYRKNGQRAYDLSAGDIDEGVSIKTLNVGGVAVPADKQRRTNTFLDVPLDNAPLTPKSSIRIQVSWSYVLPLDEGAPREFATSDGSVFFVPYWYPQVAVYDDLQGWASAPYNGLQEFYNDFSDYDVTITLPKGYMAWATGELQNPGDVLAPAVLEKWNKAHTASEVVPIFTEEELKKGSVFNKLKQHSFHFKASSVPDFAFAASNRYNWDATSIVVDDKTGRRTFVSAVYDTKSKDYYKVCRIGANAIRLMSTWLPGYPYPYPSMTVFNGNDGMEYPMMCNDASTGDRDPTGLTAHEISHTFFPFMMGINEQNYAWMDEGWASFFDLNLTDSLSGVKGNNRGYGFFAGNESDVPPMVQSRFLSSPAYRGASYARPQAAYLGLLDLLGYDVFHRCMVEYMDRWKGKHPMPYDFFNTWNQASGQNLDWYWRPWFFEWGYPDLGIQGVVMDESAGRQYILVERVGNQPVPIHLEVEYTDGTKETLHQKSNVWRDGKSTYPMYCPVGKSVKSATLGSRTIPDSERKNNSWSL